MTVRPTEQPETSTPFPNNSITSCRQLPGAPSQESPDELHTVGGKVTELPECPNCGSAPSPSNSNKISCISCQKEWCFVCREIILETNAYSHFGTGKDKCPLWPGDPLFPAPSNPAPVHHTPSTPTHMSLTHKPSSTSTQHTSSSTPRTLFTTPTRHSTTPTPINSSTSSLMVLPPSSSPELFTSSTFNSSPTVSSILLSHHHQMQERNFSCGQSPTQAYISSDKAVLGEMVFSSRELESIKKVPQAEWENLKKGGRCLWPPK